MVFPDRTPKPAMYEHRELASPVRILPGDDPAGAPRAVVLENRQDVRDLSWLRAEWFLFSDGPDRPGVATSVPAELPDLPAGGTARLEVPAELLAQVAADADPEAEAWLSLRLYAAEATARAPQGAFVAEQQVPLRAERRDLRARAGVGAAPAAAAAAGTGRRRRPARAPRARVGATAGPLARSHGQRPDRGDGAALGGARARPPGAAARRRGGERRFHRGHRGRRARRGAGRPAHADADTPRRRRRARGGDRGGAGGAPRPATGGVRVRGQRAGAGVLGAVVRRGTVRELSGPADRGRGRAAHGPAGGPVHALRPAAGERRAERRALVRSRGAGSSGAGEASLRVHLDEPRQVSITRYRAHDLATATHSDQLVPRPEVVVHVDAAHRGLGTASCGPDTLPEYLLGPGEYHWSYVLR